MTLYLIGLGLDNKKDISVKSLEIIKQAKEVYLESYTAIFNSTKEELEEFYERPIIIADRELIEQHPEETLLLHAKNNDICLLIVGDPLSATTHIDLILRAKEKEIPVKIIHNTSIFNAISSAGLELYKFGKTTSIPYWEGNFKPTTPYDYIKNNKSLKAHTLCLLDIKVKEESYSDVLKNKKEYKEARFMTVNEALQILLDIEEIRNEGVISENTKVIGIARATQNDECIKSGTIKELLDFDFGKPLHCIIIPGEMHFMEEDAFNMWK